MNSFMLYLRKKFWSHCLEIIQRFWC